MSGAAKNPLLDVALRMPDMTLGEIKRMAADPQADDQQLFAAGLMLVLIASCRRGDTMLESVDFFHAGVVDLGEAQIRRLWDHLRNIKS